MIISSFMLISSFRMHKVKYSSWTFISMKVKYMYICTCGNNHKANFPIIHHHVHLYHAWEYHLRKGW